MLLAALAMAQGAAAQGLSLSRGGDGAAASPRDRVQRAAGVIEGRLSEQ